MNAEKELHLLEKQGNKKSLRELQQDLSLGIWSKSKYSNKTKTEDNKNTPKLQALQLLAKLYPLSSSEHNKYCQTSTTVKIKR